MVETSNGDACLLAARMMTLRPHNNDQRSTVMLPLMTLDATTMMMTGTNDDAHDPTLIVLMMMPQVRGPRQL